METVQFRCENCRKTISGSIEIVGKRIRCPSCQHATKVETIASEATNETVDRSNLGPAVGKTRQSTGSKASKSGDAKPNVSAGSMSGTSIGPAPSEIKGTLGRFQIVRVLGQGAFGKVYKAYDPQLDRYVALKVPQFDSSDKRRVKRFLAEAKAAAQLRHPYIVPTFESGKADGKYYIASQFIEGTTLDDVIKRSDVQIKVRVASIIKIAGALQYAHDQKIVHRDIKPQNIMVDGQGEPQVMDFGLAKRVDDDSSMTTDGSVLGTPAYMPPEQAMGRMQDVGPVSDQYSLGVILYESLTLRRPFDGPPHSVIHKVIHDQPPAIASINAKVSDDLQAICAKAMAKNSADRYESVGQFADDLQRWTLGESTIAKPKTPLQKFTHWASKNRSLAISAIAAVLVLVGVSLALSAFGVYQNRVNSQLAQQQKATEDALLDAQTQRTEANEQRAEVEKRNKTVEKTLKRVEEEKRRAEEAKKRADKASEKERLAYLDSENQRQRAEWMLYQNQIRIAQVEWDLGDARSAWDSLSSCRWEFRDWEHDYLYTQFTKGQTSFLGHSTPVRLMVQNPDGMKLATCDTLGIVKIWDFQSRNDITISNLKGGAQHLAFINDGSELLIVGPTWIESFDPESGESMKKIRRRNSEFCLGVSLDGQLGAFSKDRKKLEIRESISGRRVQSIGNEDFRFLNFDFSDDNTKIASAYENRTVKIWDTVSGQEVFAISDLGQQINDVDLNATGGLMAVALDDGTIRIYNVDSKESPTILRGVNAPVICVSFNSDSTRIISGSDDQLVRVWDVATESVLNTWKGHKGRINLVSFRNQNPNQSFSCGEDNLVKLWDSSSEQQKQNRFLGFGQVNYLALDPTDRKLAVSHRGYDLRVWDIEKQADAFTVTFPEKTTSYCAEFSPDGTSLAISTSRGLAMYSSNDGKLLRQLSTGTGIFKHLIFGFDGTTLVAIPIPNFLDSDAKFTFIDLQSGESREIKLTEQNASSLIDAVLCSDGKTVVAGDSDGQIHVFDIESGKPTGPTIDAHADSITDMELSRDGKLILSAAANGTVRIWDSATYELLRTMRGHIGNIWVAKFTPGNRLVTVGQDKTIKTWSNASSKPLLSFEIPRGIVESLAIGNQKQFFVTGDTLGAITFWDAFRSENSFLLTGHSGVINDIKHTADGTRFATASDDKSVRLWNVRTGQQIRVFSGHKGRVLTCAFDPEETKLVSGSMDQTIKQFNLETGKELDGSFFAHKRGVTSVAYSEKGDFIITGGRDNVFAKWDSQTGESVFRKESPDNFIEGPKNDSVQEPIRRLRYVVNDVAISPDFRFAVKAQSNNLMQKVDLSDGKIEFDVNKEQRQRSSLQGESLLTSIGKPSGIICAAYSPDGNYFVGGGADGIIKAWTAQDGKLIAEWPAHSDRVRCLTFSIDGKWLSSGGDDNKIRIWNGHDPANADSKPIELEGHFGNVTALSFNPDGKTLVSGSEDQTIRIWPLSK